MSRTSQDDLLLAADWLECNEGDEEERSACFRVAAKLRAEADTRVAQAVSRRTGVAVRIIKARGGSQ